MKYCKWCNVEVHNTNIDECDQCWEVRWVCETNPKVVMKIYNAAQQSVQSDVMPCGHPQSAVVQSGDGTAYCGLCEASA